MNVVHLLQRDDTLAERRAQQRESLMSATPRPEYTEYARAPLRMVRTIIAMEMEQAAKMAAEAIPEWGLDLTMASHR